MKFNKAMNGIKVLNRASDWVSRCKGHNPEILLLTNTISLPWKRSAWSHFFYLDKKKKKGVKPDSNTSSVSLLQIC